jgi:hypothetical protein
VGAAEVIRYVVKCVARARLLPELVIQSEAVAVFHRDVARFTIQPVIST